MNDTTETKTTISISIDVETVAIMDTRVTQKPPKEEATTHCFRFEGRKFKLSKRKPERAAPWYTDFEFKNQRFHQSLDTNITAAAQQRACALIAAAKRDKWADIEGTRQKKAPATIAEIIAAYEPWAGHRIKDRTATNNMSCLRQILALAFDLPLKPAEALTAGTNKLSSAVLTPQTLRKYHESLLSQRLQDAAGKALTGDALVRARNTANISGSSTLAQARSVLSRAAIAHYKDLTLELPDLTEFSRETPFKRVAADYMPASDKTVADTFAAIALVKDDPNLVSAFWLAVGTGLRKSELARAQWRHLTQQQGKPWFVSAILGKDGRPITLPMLSFAAEALETIAIERKIDRNPALEIPILQGTHTETTETVFRRIGLWMTALGWGSKKKIHEIRAWAGSKIIETHGLEAASHWMRHKDQITTQRKYGRYVKIKGIDIQLPQL